MKKKVTALLNCSMLVSTDVRVPDCLLALSFSTFFVSSARFPVEVLILRKNAEHDIFKLGSVTVLHRSSMTLLRARASSSARQCPGGLPSLAARTVAMSVTSVIKVPDLGDYLKGQGMVRENFFKSDVLMAANFPQLSVGIERLLAK